MKKSLTMIVPLAILLALGSVSLATDEDAKPIELNQELNKDLDGDTSGASAEATGTDQGQADDSKFDDAELNTETRESKALADRRGRQPRRGQTASELSEVQKYWGDHKSGNSGDGKDGEDGDEMPDEDEDPDGTPTGN